MWVDFEDEVISRESKIDKILYISEIDEFIFKKFDNNGCQFIEQGNVRIYRRNNFYYRISYEYTKIRVFNKNFEQLYYLDDSGNPEREYEGWCESCNQDILSDSFIEKVLYHNEFLDNKNLSLKEILEIKNIEKNEKYK